MTRYLAPKDQVTFVARGYKNSATPNAVIGVNCKVIATVHNKMPHFYIDETLPRKTCEKTGQWAFDAESFNHQ